MSKGQRRQGASNFRNVSSESFMFINSKYVNFPRGESKGTSLYFMWYNWILWHSLLDLVLTDVKKHAYCRLWGHDDFGLKALK
jgi:hypothetical protein